MQPQFETMVRVYQGNDSYQRDAQNLAKKGWSVQNATERRPRAGCFRILFLWWLTLLRPPRPELVVTYQRSKESAQQAATELSALTQQPGHCPNCGAFVGEGKFYCPVCRANLRR